MEQDKTFEDFKKFCLNTICENCKYKNYKHPYSDDLVYCFEQFLKEENKEN